MLWEQGGALAVDSELAFERIAQLIGCKWSVMILQNLADGYNRPSALQRACSGLSAKVMNERLRKLVRFGIAQRNVFGDKPPVEVEYVLTDFGRRFMVILDEVKRLQEAVDQEILTENTSSKKMVGKR